MKRLKQYIFESRDLSINNIGQRNTGEIIFFDI